MQGETRPSGAGLSGMLLTWLSIAAWPCPACGERSLFKRFRVLPSGNNLPEAEHDAGKRIWSDWRLLRPARAGYLRVRGRWLDPEQPLAADRAPRRDHPG